MTLSRTVLLALAVGSVGCNIGPYPDLGQSLNPLPPLHDAEYVTFLASAGDHLEILTLTRSTIDAPEEPRYFLGSLGPQGEMTLTTGSWDDSEPGILALNGDLRFTRANERDKPPTQVTGSVVEEIDESQTIPYEAEGRGIRTNPGTDDATYYLLADALLYEIDLSTEEGAETLLEFLWLNLELGYSRIPGFGGAAMAQYISSSYTDFDGLLSGTEGLRVSNPLNPTNYFLYTDYSDIGGVTLSGEQNTKSDLSGSGYFYGTMEFTVHTLSDPATQTVSASEPPYSFPAVFTGSIFFGNEDGTDAVLVDRTLPSGGSFQLIVDGTTYEIPAEGFDAVNLRPIIERLETESSLRP